uniref:TOX high mobility group box family member 4 n=1 Tax=Marmota marmota marmota TaxID=9994 RepID=A0A8C5ZKB8_MARMA
MTDMTSGLMGHSQLTTIDQSELSSQLGLSLGGGTILPPAQSPEDRLSTTPSPTSSLHEDGVEDFRRQLPSQKTVVVEAGKKQKAPKKRKKKDPNEPQKPVSAYALFFRDTQAAIKGQNPNATFGEVSKIVASMWDSLGEEQKQVRKKEIKIVPPPTLKMQTTLVPPAVESSPERPMNSSPEAHTVEATSPETICEMITDVVPEVSLFLIVSFRPMEMCKSIFKSRSCFTSNTLCKSKLLAWCMVLAARTLRIHASINFIVNIFTGIHVETCVKERAIT